MKCIKEWAPLLLGMLGMACGAAISAESITSSIKNNTVSGYHCAPIVKVKTLEEAKAIIEAHQKRIGSK